MSDQEDAKAKASICLSIAILVGGGAAGLSLVPERKEPARAPARPATLAQASQGAGAKPLPSVLPAKKTGAEAGLAAEKKAPSFAPQAPRPIPAPVNAPPEIQTPPVAKALVEPKKAPQEAAPHGVAKLAPLAALPLLTAQATAAPPVADAKPEEPKKLAQKPERASLAMKEGASTVEPARPKEEVAPKPPKALGASAATGVLAPASKPSRDALAHGVEDEQIELAQRRLEESAQTLRAMARERRELRERQKFTIARADAVELENERLRPLASLGEKAQSEIERLERELGQARERADASARQVDELAGLLKASESQKQKFAYEARLGESKLSHAILDAQRSKEALAMFKAGLGQTRQEPQAKQDPGAPPRWQRALEEAFPGILITMIVGGVAFFGWLGKKKTP